jgi:hypothetical protein
MDHLLVYIVPYLPAGREERTLVRVCSASGSRNSLKRARQQLFIIVARRKAESSPGCSREQQLTEKEEEVEAAVCSGIREDGTDS